MPFSTYLYKSTLRSQKSAKARKAALNAVVDVLYEQGGEIEINFGIRDWFVVLYNGLHLSYYQYGDRLHYTIFGFSEQWDGRLKQEWAMHVFEDRSSTYLPSNSRYISQKDIGFQFVLFGPFATPSSESRLAISTHREE